MPKDGNSKNGKDIISLITENEANLLTTK